MNPIHAVILVLLPTIWIVDATGAPGSHGYGETRIADVPAGPALVGLPIYLQCAVFGPGGQILLSNGDVRFFQ